MASSLVPIERSLSAAHFKSGFNLGNAFTAGFRIWDEFMKPMLLVPPPNSAVSILMYDVRRESDRFTTEIELTLFVLRGWAYLA